MWKDNVYARFDGKIVKNSVFKFSKELVKGGRTKYNIEVYTDESKLSRNEIVFRVRCPEVELKTKALESTDFEEAKKEALTLVNKRIKEKIEYLNSLSEVFEKELKKES